jgi:hypothetical protein
MGVVESELVAAVMAHGHGHVAEVHHFHVVWVARIGAVHMITPVHGGQRGPDDRVWAIRCHAPSIGNNPTTP